MHLRQSRRIKQLFTGSLCLALAILVTSPFSIEARAESDVIPIDFIDNGDLTEIACVRVGVESSGVFSADNDLHENVYGFLGFSELTWTFSPGVRDFYFLTWAHGDIIDPSTQYEEFTVEAYDSRGELVERRGVRDVDTVFDDYESYQMSFDRRVTSITVTFTAVFPPSAASSGFIPFLGRDISCPERDLDGYLDEVRKRIASSSGESGLPSTR